MASLRLITEASTDVELWESSKSKTPYIVGIFASAEALNANKRVYSKNILGREVDKFIDEKVKTRTAWGELQHPESSEINLDRAAIIIESLEWKGNDVYGKAKIIDTPKGNILKTLVKEGKIGVSTRGLGTVSESGYVNEDFNLITIDAVADASNFGSRFMNGILEGKTFDRPEIAMTMEEAEEAFYKYQKALIEKMVRGM